MKVMTDKEQDLIIQCYRYHIDSAYDLNMVMEELQYFRDMASSLKAFIDTTKIKRKYVYDSERTEIK